MDYVASLSNELPLQDVFQLLYLLGVNVPVLHGVVSFRFTHFIATFLLYLSKNV